MANSLLAYLYPRIRGSQEDIATLALQYLLSQSKALNKAFTKQIADCLGVELDESLQYTCQSVGENHERPDMVGSDALGHERIICEMKFYAGLTANQPLGYLDRLKDAGGKGLVFICPKARQTMLWSKLYGLCAQRDRNPALELGGEDARAGGRAEDAEVEHEHKLIDDGHAAHGDRAHLTHHHIVQHLDEIGDAVLDHHRQRHSQDPPIELLV